MFQKGFASKGTEYEDAVMVLRGQNLAASSAQSLHNRSDAVARPPILAGSMPASIQHDVPDAVHSQSSCSRRAGLPLDDDADDGDPFDLL